VDTSIHWHGLILPYQMDGVPGVSYPGIAPGETFVYQFKVVQSGTYWYHSHSGMQEQTGLYGSIVIDPARADTIRADREYVVQLSDWTDENPHRVLSKLKMQSDYYNHNQPTAADFIRDAGSMGVTAAFDRRKMWNQMRMSPTDLADRVILGSPGQNLDDALDFGLSADYGVKFSIFSQGCQICCQLVNKGRFAFFALTAAALTRPFSSCHRTFL
jgi:hypothetical protein